LPGPLCPVCARENAPAAAFCFACGAFLATRAEPLGGEDLRICLDALLESALEARHSAREAVIPADDLLHAYLSAFWIRPETAVTQAVEARLLAPMLQAAGAPVLDVGCGDGIHTSLLFRWRFQDAFDAFQQVDSSKSDIFDAAPAQALAVPIARQGRPIDCGVDIKASTVARARALGTFRDVREADATALPFADGAFATVHSNAIANLDDAVLDAILKECARVLRPGGTLFLSAAAEGYEDALYYHPRARAYDAAGRHEDAQRYHRLDRGRSGPLLRSRSDPSWHERLAEAGLTYESGHTYLSPPLLRFWDTGLRPFAAVVTPWVDSLRGSPAFVDTKRGIVAALETVLAPLGAEGERPDGTYRIVRARKG
jgi:SAM-dependent methyltransferase